MYINLYFKLNFDDLYFSVMLKQEKVFQQKLCIQIIKKKLIKIKQETVVNYSKNFKQSLFNLFN